MMNKDQFCLNTYHIGIIRSYIKGEFVLSVNTSVMKNSSRYCNKGI